MAEPPEPEVSPWDAIAEEAWPGGPSTSKPLTPPPAAGSPANGTHGPDSGGGPQDEDSTSSQPIYVWNPSAETESFPAVPPGKNHHEP